MIRIAIVEDEPDELLRLTAILGHLGVCAPFVDGETFLKAIHRDTYDLVCIDWNLPDLSGVELIKRIRGGRQAPKMPVILITVRRSDEEVVTGLVSGADDYVTKPVRESVLLARVDTLLRRLAPVADNHIENYGDYTFDLSQSSVKICGNAQTLTMKEFNLALLFFRNLQRPLARSYLMEEVWGLGTDVSSRTLDTHVCRLRVKLALSPENGYSFGPIYGFGYRLEKIVSYEPEITPE